MKRALAILILAGCPAAEPPDPWAEESLDPEPNPFTEEHPLWAPQPHRDRPRAAVLSADGATLWVALAGHEDVPSHEVARVDLATRAVRRVEVGRAPVALALHPDGRYLLVGNLLTNRATVIDTTTDRVVLEQPVPWYTSAVAFSRDGRRAYLASRWKDSVITWELDTRRGFEIVDDGLGGRDPWEPIGTPVSANPDVLAVGDDGRVWVGAVAGEGIDVLDASGAHVDRIDLQSPAGGLLLADRWLVTSHIGRGVGYPHDDGVDGDEDGAPGDGTGNVMFQDLQNELEVFDTTTLSAVAHVTSDTICCHDYRDVDPDDPARGQAIPAPETWPPERAAAMSPRDTWIVGGALPTRLAPLGPPAGGVQRLLVIFSASNQAQRLDLDLATGALSAPDGDLLYPTGHAPVDVVAAPDGRTAYVVARLGEDVTVLPTGAPPDPGAPRDRIVVGDTSGGDFPATDVELGELFNNVTAPLTVDGDQSCVHCHRDGGNLDRVVAMPLQTDRLWGSRQVQAYRGAFDTRPWFLEAAMDEKNFFPVLNEFDRKENFCCEQLDPLIWPAYPSVGDCLDDPALAGCDHVLDCEATPPPECATRQYGSPHATRNAFLLAAAEALSGRRTTFGDSLVLAGTDEPIALDFDGVTRAIGLFLLASPRLPPNPNRALGLAAAERGRALYERPEVGCATCHPLPVTTVASEPAFSPAGVAVRLPPVITPSLNPAGQICDTVTQGFRDTFQVGTLGPTEQGPEGIHFGIPQLRGLWDRAPRFFHDGRARSLRSALLPPGHPALGGAPGFNERYGMPDSHGGTSQLSAEEIDDLLAFLSTL